MYLRGTDVYVHTWSSHSSKAKANKLPRIRGEVGYSAWSDASCDVTDDVCSAAHGMDISRGRIEDLDLAWGGELTN
jgi:hypothetical protein